MPKDQAPTPTDLAEMKQKLAEWRGTQPARAPLPDSLWQPIIKLARKHGLYRTARSLPIDYGTLKRRCTGQVVRGKSVLPTSFVELIPASASPTGCLIEMVRIETKGAVDWAQVLEGWRRHGA